MYFQIQGNLHKKIYFQIQGYISDSKCRPKGRAWSGRTKESSTKRVRASVSGMQETTRKKDIALRLSRTTLRHI